MGKRQPKTGQATMRELGLIKSQLIDDYQPIPLEWLKALKKYYSITDRYSAREISDELERRKLEK